MRPPFLAYALAASDPSRTDGFRGPLLRAGLIVIGLVTAVAAAVGVSLVIAGQAAPRSAAVFGMAAVCVGIVAVVAWLAGQAMPRTAAILAPSLFAVGALSSAIFATQPFTPWGWVGLAYPSTVTETSTLLPIAALTTAAIAAVPTLMNRLTPSGLIAQSTRWEAASSHAAGMELADAISVYGATPRAGRRWRAVRPAAGRVGVFVARDAVGAARTPVPLTVDILAVMSAAALSRSRSRLGRSTESSALSPGSFSSPRSVRSPTVSDMPRASPETFRSTGSAPEASSPTTRSSR